MQIKSAAKEFVSYTNALHGNVGNVLIHCHRFGLDSQVFTGNRKLSPATFSLA